MTRRPHRLVTILFSATVVVAAVSAATAAAPAQAHARHRTTISTVKTSLGRVVADRHGRVMFRFMADHHGRSACSAVCRSVWPPVRSGGRPRAGKHVSQADLGHTAKRQVTYHGHPLYYYTGDPKPGKTVGDGIREYGGKWYVVSPAGRPVKPSHHHGGGGPAGAAVVTTGTVAGTTVLTSADGHTLYELSSETDTPPTFFCTGACTQVWPPLLTKGAPTAAGQAQATQLGTVTRPDGSTQVSYRHHPLYDYSGDHSAGTGNGEGIYDPPGYWYQLTPAGGPR